MISNGEGNHQWDHGQSLFGDKFPTKVNIRYPGLA